MNENWRKYWEGKEDLLAMLSTIEENEARYPRDKDGGIEVEDNITLT